jgi:hypothetical protein
LAAYCWGSTGCQRRCRQWWIPKRDCALLRHPHQWCRVRPLPHQSLHPHPQLRLQTPDHQSLHPHRQLREQISERRSFRLASPPVRRLRLAQPRRLRPMRLLSRGNRRCVAMWMPVPLHIVLSPHRTALINQVMDHAGSARSNQSDRCQPLVPMAVFQNVPGNRLGDPRVAFQRVQSARANHAVPGLPHGFDGFDQHSLARSTLADLATTAA